MGQDPEVIRREIEETRDSMGDTVDALGYKADVKGRAKESVQDRKDAVVGKVQSVMGRAGDATPSTDDAKRAGRQAAGVAQENPLGLAIGAVAVGFVAGMVIPSTRVEDERIGDIADQVKGQIQETASDAVKH